MTNMLLITLLSTIGIVLVHGECRTNYDGTIKSCCCLGYNNTSFNTKSSGVYTIANFCGVKCSNTRAYCDTTSGGGGWLVVQRRQDGSVDFNRDWVDYEDGFGSLTGEFWYGLRPLHCLTNHGQWELRIDFTLTDRTKGYLSYSSFKIGPASSNYTLSILGFKGTTSSDPFSDHPLNGMPFTTKDRDNDKWVGGNCATADVNGGWWSNTCSHIRINNPTYKHVYFGFYLPIGGWRTSTFTEMKIRPLNCEA